MGYREANTEERYAGLHEGEDLRFEIESAPVRVSPWALLALFLPVVIPGVYFILDNSGMKDIVTGVVILTFAFGLPLVILRAARRAKRSRYYITDQRILLVSSDREVELLPSAIVEVTERSASSGSGGVLELKHAAGIRMLRVETDLRELREAVDELRTRVLASGREN